MFLGQQRLDLPQSRQPTPLQIFQLARAQARGARFQLGQLEGLGEEVVRALVEAAHPLAQRVARGQHQHGDALVARAQPAQDGAAVAPGQAQVEHQRVVVALGQRALHQAAVVAPVHAAAALFEGLGQPLAQGPLVFGQQDAHGADYLRRPPAPLKGN